ncbi:MAG: FecR family protein [bacterium]|nr:FecR family protein [bacterium]
MDFKNIDPNKIGKIAPPKSKLPPIPKEAFGDSLPKRQTADNKGGVIKPPPVSKQQGRISPDKLMAQQYIQPPKPSRMDSYVPPAIETTSEPIHVSKTKFFVTAGCIGSVFLVLVIVGIIYMLSGSGGGAGGGTASIDLVQGKDVKRNLDGSTWATLSIPTKLTTGDLLKSGDDRYNVLVTADKSTIRLNANTSVKIVKIASSGTGQNISLYLYSGSIFISEKPDTHITVETKYAKAVPIGTRYYVAQIERKDLTEQTLIKVIEGTIQASHVDAPDAKSVIQASEQASVTAQSITKPSEMKMDNWLRWNSAWTDPSNIPDKNAGKKSTPAPKNAPANTVPDTQAQQNAAALEEQKRAMEVEAKRREEEEAKRRHDEESARFEDEQRHRREMDEKRQAEERRRADEERDRQTRREIERARKEEEERQRQLERQQDEFERLHKQDEERAKAESAARDKNRPTEDPYNIKTGNINNSQQPSQQHPNNPPQPPPPGGGQAPGDTNNSSQQQNGMDAVTTTGTIMMPTGTMDEITAKPGKYIY